MFSLNLNVTPETFDEVINDILNLEIKASNEGNIEIAYDTLIGKEYIFKIKNDIRPIGNLRGEITLELSKEMLDFIFQLLEGTQLSLF